jgi:O-antigen/teichoic acid export membrane protein
MPTDSKPHAGAARRFARNSAFGTVAGMLTALGSVLASVIVAHALGVSATGTVAFALWAAMLAASIADLGVQASLARYLPELTASDRDDEGFRLAGMLWRRLAAAAGLTLAGFAGWALWRWRAGDLSGADAALWSLVGVACALQALTGFTFGYLRGMQHFDRLARLTTISFVCQIAGVAIGCASFGEAGAVAGYCAGSAIPAALSFRFAVSGRRPSVELAVRVRRFALYAWAAALSSTFVWSRAELFFLQRSNGSVAVGLFTVGVTLANLASQGPLLLTAGLLPYFAESFGKGAVSELRDAYATATRVLAFLVFPVCFGLAALLPKALPLVFGNAFADAVPAATVLVLAAGIGAVSSVGTSVIMATDRSDFVFVCGLIAAVLAVAAGFTVIPAFGVIGAACSRAVVQIAAVALGSAFIFWRLRLPLPGSDLGKLLLAALACGIAARLCLEIPGTVAPLILAIGAGGLSYAVSVRALRALCPADAERLRVFCRGLPPPLRNLCEGAIGLLAPVNAIPPAAAIAAVSRARSAGNGR